MAFQDTKIYSVLTLTCPKCHEGKLFVKSNAYSLSGSTEMNRRCSVCNEDFQREPGFYFGAAYVSYALTVALWVAVWVALATFDVIGLIEFALFEDPVFYLVTGIISLLLLFPLLYRLSRAIWINMFTKYDRTKRKKK